MNYTSVIADDPGLNQVDRAWQRKVSGTWRESGTCGWASVNVRDIELRGPGKWTPVLVRQLFATISNPSWAEMI